MRYQAALRPDFEGLTVRFELLSSLRQVRRSRKACTGYSGKCVLGNHEFTQRENIAARVEAFSGDEPVPCSSDSLDKPNSWSAATISARAARDIGGNAVRVS